MNHGNHFLLTTYTLISLIQTCTAMDNNQQIWQFNNTFGSEAVVIDEETIKEVYTKLYNLSKTKPRLFIYVHMKTFSSNLPTITDKDYDYLQKNGFITQNGNIEHLTNIIINIMIKMSGGKAEFLSYDALKAQNKIKEMQENMSQETYSSCITISRSTINKMFEFLTYLVQNSPLALNELFNCCKQQNSFIDPNKKEIFTTLSSLNLIYKNNGQVPPLIKKLILIMVEKSGYFGGLFHIRSFNELVKNGSIKPYDDRKIQEKESKKTTHDVTGSGAEIRTQDLRIMIPSL